MAATVGAGSALQAHREALPNGLTLLYNRAEANPSVVVRAIVRAGASRESGPEEQGLAGFTGRMLRQGTETLNKEALAEALDGMGAGLSVDVGYGTTVASIKCLSDDFARAVQILGQVLLHPTLPEAELERLRGQVITDLREMLDNTRVVSERTWREQAYPAQHRYSRPVSGTPETVERFGNGDVKRFYHRWFGANQTTLVVVGNVELATAREVAQDVFGQWGQVGATPLPETMPDTPLPEASTHSVAMVGKTQNDLVLGLPTLNRLHPDYYALAFANHILGRMYFMGRFGEKVRDEQGLAYYAYSELQAGFGSGPWAVRAGVNPRNMVRAVASIRHELQRFLDEGPTEAEQADGVSSVLGSLPRQLETNEGMAAVLGEIDMYDLGLDFLDRYPGIIQALTREQVTAAARHWLREEHLVTAIAGPAWEA